MTALAGNPSVETLAWTLVHFLWQGGALGLALFVWLRAARPGAQARYAAGIMTLAALLAAPVVTCAWLSRGEVPVPPPMVLAGDDASSPMSRAAAQAADPIASSGPPPAEVAATAGGAAALAPILIVWMWAAGVLVLTLRLVGGWLMASRLAVRATAPAAADICALAASLSHRLGLRRAVRIVESTAVSVPVLVGWLKPVVVLPVSALSGLSREQIEGLIAHELAHVRRHDYVVNILQSIVETLLFYHPVTWFVSRQVREAREQCCDDVAIGVCDPVVYVTALAELAAMGRTPRLALAATGGSLLGRVQRILGQPREMCGPGTTWLGVISLTLIVGVIPGAIGSSGSYVMADGQAVAGGVAEGVEGGIAGGVEAGLGGGVTGIVREGVTGRAAGDGARTVQAQDVQREGAEPDARPARRQESVSRARPVRAEELQRPVEPQAIAQNEMRALEARLAELERQVAAGRESSPERPEQNQAAYAARSTVQLEVRVMQARAEVDAARAELERSLRLSEVGLLPTPALREAEARVAAAERELAAIAIEIQATAEEAAVRDGLDTRRARLAGESAMQQAQLDLAAEQQQLALTEQRVRVGTAGRDALMEASRRFRAAEQRLQAARTELALSQEEAAFRQARTADLRRLARELEDLRAPIRAWILPARRAGGHRSRGHEPAG